MAESQSSTLAPSKSYRRQALIWLMMTLLLGVVTALVWMFSQTSAIGAQDIENAPLSTPQTTIDELKQPLSIESLNELDTDVQPIDFEATVRDLRSYPDEFKDKSYLSANKGKWTVQVMNVAENEVIASYLEGRDDREKFAYFRYLDENKQRRYMLTYGIMSSPQEAVGAAKLIDFGLPADVRVLPEEINRYVSIIDNYERPGPIKDLSNRRARSVRLQRTQREVPVRRQATTSNETTDTDTNTSADTIRERAERNIANDNDASAANSAADSIRQSDDTSATLSVNEERSIETEGTEAVKKPENSRKTETEVKKPPVVAAPKPPTANANSSTNNATSSTNNATNSNKANPAKATSKDNNDAIKELIEERSN